MQQDEIITVWDVYSVWKYWKEVKAWNGGIISCQNTKYIKGVKQQYLLFYSKGNVTYLPVQDANIEKQLYSQLWDAGKDDNFSSGSTCK